MATKIFLMLSMMVEFTPHIDIAVVLDAINRTCNGHVRFVSPTGFVAG